MHEYRGERKYYVSRAKEAREKKCSPCFKKRVVFSPLPLKVSVSNYRRSVCAASASSGRGERETERKEGDSERLKAATKMHRQTKYVLRLTGKSNVYIYIYLLTLMRRQIHNTRPFVTHLCGRQRQRRAGILKPESRMANHKEKTNKYFMKTPVPQALQPVRPRRAELEGIIFNILQMI